MKKLKKVIAICLIFVCSQILFGCLGNTNSEKYKLIRIHIRADSNSESAQAVKLQVRDRVTDYLNLQLQGVTDFSIAYVMMEQRLQNITAISDSVLKANGFSYTSNVTLNNQYFPTRDYDGTVVQSGYYDALIIRLGSGNGDNWWCVIYPPLCYVTENNGGGFKYKSWFAELWEKYFNNTFR